MIEWLVVVYFASFMVISIYTVALMVVIIRYRRYKSPANVDISNGTPDVTVQLPVFNPDCTSFTRCIDAITKMVYPPDHLQIQVLDDSTSPDEICFIKEACKTRKIEFIHRDTREGYRAGAFANSMPSVRGEYIAIINVDNIPPINFLEKMVATIHAHPSVGYVMSNPIYHNRQSSNQASVTSIILDLGVMNLNGLSMLTGGGVVIRKQAIIDAGGWQGDTICDDYDIGSRILSKGYGSLFLREMEFPCEAPESFSEYRRTTERWARASGQYIRKDLGSILMGRMDEFEKFLLLALSTGFVQMLASVINLLAVLALISLNSIPGSQYAFLWSIVSVTGFSLYIYYYYVTKFRGLSMRGNIRNLVLAVVIGYGSIFFVAYNLLKGFFETGKERAVMRVNSTFEQTVVDGLFVAVTLLTLTFAVFYGNAILSCYMLLNLVGISLIRTNKA